MMGPDEELLLTKAKAGSSDAFERLVARYLPKLLAYGWAICGDYHTAQDALQESLLIAYDKLEHFEAGTDLLSWLQAITRLCSLNARRRLSKTSPVTEEAIERLYYTAASEGLPYEGEALSKCLQSLGGTFQRVVRDHYFSGMALSDIAAAIGTTVSAVKQALYRARLALRDCVRRRLSTEATS